MRYFENVRIVQLNFSVLIYFGLLLVVTFLINFVIIRNSVAVDPYEGQMDKEVN